MAAFIAKMRDVDDGGRIVGLDAQSLAGLHGAQSFAGFENRQGAQEADCVEILVKCHTATHKDVSISPQGCDQMWRDGVVGAGYGIG